MSQPIYPATPVTREELVALVEEAKAISRLANRFVEKVGATLLGDHGSSLVAPKSRKTNGIPQRILGAISRSAEYLPDYPPQYGPFLRRNAMTRTQIFRALGNPAGERAGVEAAIDAMLADKTLTRLQISKADLPGKGRLPEMVVLTSQLHRFYSKMLAAEVEPLPSTGFVPAHVIAQFKENYGEPLAQAPVATPPADNYGYPPDFVPPTGESIEVYAARMAEFRKNLQMADLSSPRDEY